jgi:hypothetical protein
MAKKKLLIWVCEDNVDEWEYQIEVLKENFPKATIKHFENAGYAAQSTGSPDVVLIDVGGACTLGCNVVSLTRYNVEGLYELHPSAIYIIFSAIGKYAEDVYEELSPEMKFCCHFFNPKNGSSYNFNGISDLIKTHV